MVDLFDFSRSGGVTAGSAAPVGAGSTFFPTLFIGLGGTGAEVMLRVKKLLGERAQENTLTRFLFFDTDHRTFADREDFPSIAGNEKYLIGVNQVQTLLSNPDLHPHIWERFPPNQLRKNFINNLRQGQGAGQIRSLGALAFVLDAVAVADRIQSAFRDLITISSHLAQALTAKAAVVGEDVVIYVAGSLNGGTGSGCFLDASLLARHLCSQRNPHLILFASLPSTSYDEKVAGDPSQPLRMRANAYAALKELQFVLDTSEPGRKDVVYDLANQSITLARFDKLFDRTYLVDDHSIYGGLGNVEALYDLMARQIFLEVGTPFGAEANSFNSNNGVITGVEACPETNRPRLLGTISTAALVYPAERVSLYCTYRQLADVIQDRLLGSALEQAEIDRRVTEFLSVNRYDDRGSNNQILDSLLVKSRQVVGQADFGLARSWGGRSGVEEFAERIRSSWNDFENRDLPKIRNLAQDNLTARLGHAERITTDPLGDSVRGLAMRTAAETNPGSTERLLTGVLDAVVAMHGELKAEEDAWSTTNRELAEQDFSRLCAELKSVKLARIRKKDERIKAQLRDVFNERVQQELWAAARPKAMQLLAVLEKAIRDELARWRNVSSDLASLVEAAKRESARLETSAGSSGSGFILEQEITSAGYERRYYEANRLTPDQALETILADCGKAEDLYSWLLDLPSRSRSTSTGNRLGGALYSRFAGDLKNTDIIEFIEKGGADVAGKLDTRLSGIFEMCQPFWSVRPPRVNMSFPEFLGISVGFRPGRGTSPRPPKRVTEWVETLKQGRGNRFQPIPSDRRYELGLSRCTYGARAFYLSDAGRWKEIYDSETTKAQKKYMLETHSAYSAAPDIFPTDERPYNLFALGMAFGFIVTRGDFYYFGLEESGDEIRVLYDSQAETVFGDVAPPSTAGDLLFRVKKQPRLPTGRQLAHGREAAREEFAKNDDYVSLVERAVDIYQSAVGNAQFRKELTIYRATVLEPKKKEEDDVFAQEAASIDQKVSSIGR